MKCNKFVPVGETTGAGRWARDGIAEIDHTDTGEQHAGAPLAPRIEAGAAQVSGAAF
jgi:hypothetical protein